MAHGLNEPIACDTSNTHEIAVFLNNVDMALIQKRRSDIRYCSYIHSVLFMVTAGNTPNEIADKLIELTDK